MLLAANLLGGASYAGMKLAMRGLPESGVIAIRILVQLVCFGLILGRGALAWPYRGRDLGLLLLVGGAGFALPLALCPAGMALSSSANASILVLLEPIGIVILSALFLKERATRLQTIGILLGFAGAVLVVLAGPEDPALLRKDYLAGNLLLAAHGVLWAVYTVSARPLLTRHSSLSVAYAASWVALAGVSPWLLWETSRWTPQAGLVEPALGWALAVALAVGVGCTWLWNEGLRLGGPIAVAGFIFLQPLVGTWLGHLAFGEKLGGEVLAGGALIAAAVLLVAWGERRAAGGPASQPDSAT